jgi:hypothetical protein
MACGRRPPKLRRAARDFPDIRGRRSDAGALGQGVDNFVDKLLRCPLGAMNRGLGRLDAQKNSTKNPLNINHLQHSIAAARVTTVRNASIGAAVDRSPRAGGRFVDG